MRLLAEVPFDKAAGRATFPESVLTAEGHSCWLLGSRPKADRVLVGIETDEAGLAVLRKTVGCSLLQAAGNTKAVPVPVVSKLLTGLVVAHRLTDEEWMRVGGVFEPVAFEVAVKVDEGLQAGSTDALPHAGKREATSQ